MSTAFAFPRLSRLLALLALLLLCLSAYAFRPDVIKQQQSETMNAAFVNATTSDGIPQDPLFSVALVNEILTQGGVAAGTGFMLAGGVVLGLAILTSSRATSDPLRRHSQETTPGWRAIHWRYLLAGIGLLWLVGEVGGNGLGIAFIADMSSHVQFVLFCAGLILLISGLAKSPNTYRQRKTQWRWEQSALVAIMLLAFALRIIDLHRTLRVIVDELHFMSDILTFWSRGDVELTGVINNLSPFARFYTYGQTWSVELLGRNFLGFRGLSALLGTLNVLAVYWLVRHLFDRKTGLWAALFLATFPPHLHFSRLAIIQIGDPLVGTLALAFIARGTHPLAGGYALRFRPYRQLDWAVAGVCLGMTQYFYEGGKLLFPIITALWLLGLWLGGKVRWRDLTIMVIAAVATAMPVYYTAAVTDSPLTGRLTASGLPADYWAKLLVSGVDSGQIQMQLNHAAVSLLMYVHMPERAVYYGGYHPLVLELLVPLFLLGCWWVIWKRRGSVLLLWLLFTALGSSLLVQNAVASRYVVALPALAMVIAVGAHGLGALLFSQIRQKPRLVQAAFAMVCILLAGTQAVYYFADHIPTFDTQFRRARGYRDVEDALLRAAVLPTGTEVYLVMGEGFNPGYNRDFLKFLTDDITVETITSDEVKNLHPSMLHSGRQIVFFIAPDDLTAFETLHKDFILSEPEYSPYDDVPTDQQFALYFVSRRS